MAAPASSTTDNPTCAVDQTATETMLTATATRSAPAFLESIDQIGARTLPRRIEAHEQDR